MITCPKCKNTLPDWAQTCQFCHADLKSVQRPVAVKKETSYYGQMGKWVYPCYYAISGYIVFIALVLALMTLLAGNLDVISKISLAVDALILIVGVGLLVQNDFIRGIGMYFAAVAAVFSIFQTVNIMMYNASIPAMNKQNEQFQKALFGTAPPPGQNPLGTAGANGSQSSIQFVNQDGQPLTPDQKKQLDQSMKQIQDQVNKELEQSMTPDQAKQFEQQEKQQQAKNPDNPFSTAPLKPISPIVLILSLGNIFVFLFLMYLIYETEHNSY